MPLARRNGHYLFAIIQSGLTCLIATGIASLPLVRHEGFWQHWARSWVLAWLTMLPVVILAAPVIQRIVDRLTHEG